MSECLSWLRTSGAETVCLSKHVHVLQIEGVYVLSTYLVLKYVSIFCIVLRVFPDDLTAQSHRDQTLVLCSALYMFPRPGGADAIV